MTATNNVYYIFIEEYNQKSILKFVQDFDWKVMPITGNIPSEFKNYSHHYDIYKILSDLRDNYDYVEEISFNDIDDYMD